MKKLLTIILAISLLTSLVACGNKQEEILVDNNEVIEDVENPEATPEQTEEAISDPTAKPTDKPTQKPTDKPTDAPTKAPEQTAVTEPIVKDETLGTTLLAEFKKIASGKTSLQIAEALVTNPAILFSGGAMEVEEGLLSGFDNAEITGFKSGAVFMPMIGSIAFIGYVFELENSADAPVFISNLEKNANKRWNICVEAEEMVTGVSGNKVFFVMCPKSLEE